MPLLVHYSSTTNNCFRSGIAGVDERGQATISSMEKRGTKVSVFSVDVGDFSRVETLIKDLESGGYPPLRGIIQSSMVLEDCLAVHSSLQKYFNVSDPKVRINALKCTVNINSQ